MTPPRNIKLTLAYDGSGFFGWQKTPHGPSIEQSLNQALDQILQENVSIQAASRTDRGVHAEGQVVNFFTKKNISLNELIYRLNALLPKQIRVIQGQNMPSCFHPTLDAMNKQYYYFLCLGPVQLPRHIAHSWHIARPLNLKNMALAAKAFTGTHDFSALCNVVGAPKDGDTVRTLSRIELVSLENNRLKMIVQGDAFLYRMVRNLVGTLVEVGLGKRSPTEIKKILESKKRVQAGISAPAHPLFLMKVFYAEGILEKNCEAFS